MLQGCFQGSFLYCGSCKTHNNQQGELIVAIDPATSQSVVVVRHQLNGGGEVVISWIY